MNIMELPATETFEQKRDRLLTTWQAACNTLAVTKEAEMALRKEVTAFLFPNPSEGTQRIELPKGYAVKLVYGFNYNIEKDNDKVDAAVDLMAKMGPEGAFVAERLLKWKADLSVSEYRTLSERAGKYEKDQNGFPEYATEWRILRELNNIMTITPKSPTLEIEEPKKGSRP